jgi:hypothetical protein
MLKAKLLSSVSGVEKAVVELEERRAYVWGAAGMRHDTLTAAVTEAGFGPGAVGLVLEPDVSFGAGTLILPCFLEMFAALALISVVPSPAGQRA